MPDNNFLHPAFTALLSAFLAETPTVYIVGGAVRDLLLAKEAPTKVGPHHGKNLETHNTINDLDMVLPRPVMRLARSVADKLGWAFFPLDTGRDIARLVFGHDRPVPLICDVSQMRGEDIYTDLAGRDFTINAMALVVERNAPPRLLDYHHGADDLKNRLLRCVSPVSLADDAVRLLRAVRLSVEFDLSIDQQTRAQIQRLARTIQLASPERIRDELWKMLVSSAPATAVEELYNLGLLPYVLPEIATLRSAQVPRSNHQDAFQHTLAAAVELCAIKDWILGHGQGQDQGQHKEESAARFAMRRKLQPFRYDLRQALSTSLAVGHSRIDWMIFHVLFQHIGLARSASTVTDSKSATNQTDGTSTNTEDSPEAISAKLAAGRLTHLRFSRLEVVLVETVVQNQRWPDELHQFFGTEPISRRACYRYFRDVGNRQFSTSPGIDILIMSLANRLATFHSSEHIASVSNDQTKHRIETSATDHGMADLDIFLDHLVQLLHFILHDQRYRTIHERPLINGHQLMQHFDLQPGEQVGHILERLREAQVVGEVSTPQEALQLASGLLHESDT